MAASADPCATVSVPFAAKFCAPGLDSRPIPGTRDNPLKPLAAPLPNRELVAVTDLATAGTLNAAVVPTSVAAISAAVSAPSPILRCPCSRLANSFQVNSRSTAREGSK